MEEQSEYEIEEITGLSFEEVTSILDHWATSVGEMYLEAGLKNRLRQLKAFNVHIFLLRWAGRFIPRGAKLGEHTIAGTLNGIVLNEQGEQIACCDWLLEFGDESRFEQVLLVYVE